MLSRESKSITDIVDTFFIAYCLEDVINKLAIEAIGSILIKILFLILEVITVENVEFGEFP